MIQLIDTLDIIALLEALAVGADAALFATHDWNAVLSKIRGGDGFVWQLEKEWFVSAAPSPLAEMVMEKCYQRISAWHSGWPNLWAHTLRVTGYALRLAPEAALTAEQAFITAMLHDVGKFEEYRTGVPHEQYAAETAQQLLGTLMAKPVVAGIVAAVGKTGRPGDDYVRLLYDADKLDKIGASGVVRRVSATLTLDNAFTALDRVDSDLRDFPVMKHPAAQAIAERKRAYTEQLLRLRSALTNYDIGKLASDRP